MIAYLDTSAVVPLLVRGSRSETCRQIWDAAHTAVSCRMLFVEATAALAHARRMHRLSDAGLDAALNGLMAMWSEVDVVELDDVLSRQAARLAREQGLRWYHAVHCAAGVSIAADDVVAVTGDRDLLAVWDRLGLATCDTSR